MTNNQPHYNIQRGKMEQWQLTVLAKKAELAQRMYEQAQREGKPYHYVVYLAAQAAQAAKDLENAKKGQR